MTSRKFVELKCGCTEYAEDSMEAKMGDAMSLCDLHDKMIRNNEMADPHQEGNWRCRYCLLVMPPEVTECVSCGTPREETVICAGCKQTDEVVPLITVTVKRTKRYYCYKCLVERNQI